MKKLLLSISLILIFSFQIQEDWKYVFKLNTSVDFFTTDNIGNFYVIKGDEVKKFNSSGELLKVFSNKRAGKLFSIDASNPLRVIAFYKEQSQITILDSQLSPNGENINLENLSLEQCDLVCSSFNNGIWLFNRQNAELVRLGENLNRVLNTGNLNNLMSTKFVPNFMIENNSYLYLNNPEEGIFVFDIYGTYYKTIPIKHLTQFQVREDVLYFQQDGKLNAFNLKTIDRQTIALPTASKECFRFFSDRYSYLKNDSVFVMERK